MTTEKEPSKEETKAKATAKKKTAAKKKTTRKTAAKKKAASKKNAKTTKTTTTAKANGVVSGTKLTAMVDVGWGNSLYVRGDGPGLSWDQGALMTNVESNSWEWQTGEASSDFNVKFLINDDHWSSGENFEVKAGESQTTTPQFFVD